MAVVGICCGGESKIGIAAEVFGAGGNGGEMLGFKLVGHPGRHAAGTVVAQEEVSAIGEFVIGAGTDGGSEAVGLSGQEREKWEQNE